MSEQLKGFGESPKEKNFKLHWIGGKEQDISGTDISNALETAGYRGGALSTLDYWEEISEKKDKNNDSF